MRNPVSKARSSGEHKFSVPPANICTWGPHHKRFLWSAEVGRFQTVAPQSTIWCQQSMNKIDKMWKHIDFRETAATAKQFENLTKNTSCGTNTAKRNDVAPAAWSTEKSDIGENSNDQFVRRGSVPILLSDTPSVFRGWCTVPCRASLQRDWAWAGTHANLTNGNHLVEIGGKTEAARTPVHKKMEWTTALTHLDVAGLDGARGGRKLLHGKAELGKQQTNASTACAQDASLKAQTLRRRHCTLCGNAPASPRAAEK